MIVILFLSLVEINSIYFCKYKKTLEIFLNQQLTKCNFQPSSMSINELRVNYKKLLNKADKAIGRKETVSYLNRAAKLKSKIYSKTKTNCVKCNGVGYLRISLGEAKTCLYCYGKGFLIKEIQKF